jgi:hypothetical protein
MIVCCRRGVDVQRIELLKREPIEVRSFDLACHVTVAFPKERFGDKSVLWIQGREYKRNATLPTC